MIYNSEDGIKVSSSSRCVSVLFVRSASSSPVGGGNQVETRRWVRERARGARVKRREDKSGVASFDIFSFQKRLLNSCQGAKAEKASTRQHR